MKYLKTFLPKRISGVRALLESVDYRTDELTDEQVEAIIHVIKE